MKLVKWAAVLVLLLQGGFLLLLVTGLSISGNGPHGPHTIPEILEWYYEGNILAFILVSASLTLLIGEPIVRWYYSRSDRLPPPS